MRQLFVPVEFEVESIDELVLILSSSEQSDMLLRIGTVRKRTMMFLRLLQGKADVVRALIKRFESATAAAEAAAATAVVKTPSADRPNIFYNPGSSSYATQYLHHQQQQQLLQSPVLGGKVETAGRNNNALESADVSTLAAQKGHEIRLYLGDILDHIVTMVQNTNHYEAVISRAHGNYLAKISIELTETSNRTNDVVAKLSALASVLVPLNVVTGLWGMNVPVPGQESARFDAGS